MKWKPIPTISESILRILDSKNRKDSHVGNHTSDKASYRSKFYRLINIEIEKRNINYGFRTRRENLHVYGDTFARWYLTDINNAGISYIFLL